MSALRWLSLFAVLGVLAPRLAQAQLELSHPSCAPDWWDDRTVAAALDVELGPQEPKARVTFVVDTPCEDRTFVSVLVEAPDGLRRRTIDVGDLPPSARPRAIGMGVAALIRGPPEPGSEPEPTSESHGEPERADEAVDHHERTTSALAAPEDGVAGAAPERPAGAVEASGDARPPAREPSAVEQAGAGGDQTDGGPGRWQLTVAGTGLWTAPGSPWVGAHGSLGWRAAEAWVVALGVDGARASESDPLGSVLGRWVSTCASLSWSHRWQWLSLGARAGLALDWVRLAGRSDQEGVRTRARSRWSAAAEIAGSVGLTLTERLGLRLDLGVHLSPWGLGARSPSGRVLAMRGASGLVRLGIRVAL